MYSAAVLISSKTPKVENFAGAIFGQIFRKMALCRICHGWCKNLMYAMVTMNVDVC